MCWHIALGYHSLASLEYENVDSAMLMYCIHLAARRALDGKMLLKQHNEATVN